MEAAEKTLGSTESSSTSDRSLKLVRTNSLEVNEHATTETRLVEGHCEWSSWY